MTEAYKAKLQRMREISESGLHDVENLEIGIKALNRYLSRIDNMTDSYRQNFISIFGQDDLDKAMAIAAEIRMFLSKLEAIANG